MNNTLKRVATLDSFPMKTSILLIRNPSPAHSSIRAVTFTFQRIVSIGLTLKIVSINFTLLRFIGKHHETSTEEGSSSPPTKGSQFLLWQDGSRELSSLELFHSGDKW